MGEIINKPFYFWSWAPAFTSQYLINTGKKSVSNFDVSTYTRVPVEKFGIYNVNPNISSVQPSPYGPSGSSDPQDIFNSMVYLDYSPGDIRWINRDRTQFVVTATGDPNGRIITGRDNQRPWEDVFIISNRKTVYASHRVSTASFIVENSGEIIPSENVLLVYNGLSPESVDLKDYYTGARTGLKGLNILEISCDSGEFTEVTHPENYIENIRDPIWSYIRNTDKPIKYCILMYGIPIRISGSYVPENNNYGITGSVGQDLSYTFYRSSGYCRHPNYETPVEIYGSSNQSNTYHSGTYSYLNMSSAPRVFDFGQDFRTAFLTTHLFADSAADVSGYIHKITGQGIVDGVYLKGNGLNTGGLIVDASSPNYEQTLFLEAARRLSGYSQGDNENIVYGEFHEWTGRTHGTLMGASALTPHITGYNINTFLSWGIHTSHAHDLDEWGNIQYTQNVPLSGGNNWFVTMHNESFGILNRDRQGDFGAPSYKSYWFSPPYKQFAPNAYGGENYSNVPVGICGHTREPTKMGHGGYSETCTQTIDFWLGGEPWIHVAHGGFKWGNTTAFVGTVIIGDPFVKCF